MISLKERETKKKKKTPKMQVSMQLDNFNFFMSNQTNLELSNRLTDTRPCGSESKRLSNDGSA